ncbi:hypothetical protein CRU99_03060 [Malaciobacter mytili]|uniref:cache domain-containing protein n=1 Tax=Malaciobacter mytili TaxID=603050 RepID=UPI00100AEB48|nr:cache domain-containing protein [Malaciobacter mytili]RXI46722.1 hypothetical protein CRU99_03060 [Malaciobacter mytili]
MKKFYIICTFIIITFITFSLLSKTYNNKKRNILENATNTVMAQYNTIFDSFDTLANTVFFGYINRPEILNSFENRNREQLYNLLKKDYDYLTSINFNQVHFHLPNNYSFLRMHKPSLHSDDLSDIRFSVKYVNRYKRPINGIEMGRIVPGFRYVYPLYKEEKYLGSIETSFSINAFINRLEKVYNVHVHFLLDKEVFNKKIFDIFKGYYETSIESKNYILLKRENFYKKRNEEKNIIKQYESSLKSFIEDSIKNKDNFSFEMQIFTEDGQHFHKIVTFLELFNIQKEKIGYFVVYQNNNELNDIEKQLNENYLIFSLIYFLILAYILKEVSTKKQLEEKVFFKTKELNELNQSLENRIQEEVEKSLKQEEQLYQYEKMAQMGEMIGNIAHQWRQPLTAISVASSGLKLADELNILDKHEIKNYANVIIKNTNYLSNTIDIFRDYTFKNSNIKDVIIQDLIYETIDILSATLKNEKIKLITDITDELIIKNLLANDLIQAIINIVNNAKDALLINKIEAPWIKISLLKKEKFFTIIIEDNANGIEKEIMPKIFDPYFTTKHQAQGVGLGLHLTRKAIVNRLKGSLEVNNSINGAIFYINIPL